MMLYTVYYSKTYMSYVTVEYNGPYMNFFILFLLEICFSLFIFYCVSRRGLLALVHKMKDISVKYV
jgi:hypothetical protein